jgi:hypothetical protein
MTDCLGIEFPDDKRIKIIMKILEQYNVDYIKFHFKTFIPPHKIKIILFQPRQIVIDEILEYSKSEYGKEDYLRQSSLQLNDNERKFIIDLVLK